MRRPLVVGLIELYDRRNISLEIKNRRHQGSAGSNTAGLTSSSQLLQRAWLQVLLQLLQRASQQPWLQVLLQL